MLRVSRSNHEHGKGSATAVLLCVAILAFALTCTLGADAASGADACPVTQRAAPPEPAPLRFVSPLDGVVRADLLPDGTYHLALTWLVDEARALTIRVKHLDGTGKATVYDPLSARPGIGMHPVDIVLTSLGCWRFTGALGSERLTVVLRVEPSGRGVVAGWQGGACPVTMLVDPERGHGSDALRVLIPDDGAYAAPSDPDGGFFLKIPWNRGREGNLRVRGTRLDGPGTASVSIHEASYPPTGFLPTGITVSDLGCWRITGKLDDVRVSAVIRVKDAGTGPAG
jgi:hypothetical protein